MKVRVMNDQRYPLAACRPGDDSDIFCYTLQSAPLVVAIPYNVSGDRRGNWQSFKQPTEALDWLEQLKSEGYRIPQRVIDALKPNKKG